MGIAAGIVPDIEDQLLGTLSPQRFNSRYRLIGTAVIKIGNADEAGVSFQQQAGGNCHLHSSPENRHWDYLFFPADGNLNRCAFFTPYQFPGSRGGYTGGIMAIDFDDHIIHLHARFLRAAAGIHLHNLKSGPVLSHGDGDTDTHIGIFLSLNI